MTATIHSRIIHRMAIEAGISAGGGKEIKSQISARYLTPQELEKSARRDLSGLVGNRKLKTVDRFLTMFLLDG